MSTDVADDVLHCHEWSAELRGYHRKIGDVCR